MAIRTSEAEWRGDLKSGQGEVKLGSGALSGSYSYRSRFENGQGTNPEELIAAAHAGCFSMALSATLAETGHPPAKIHTTAKDIWVPCQAASRFLASTL
jgi:lipoyl-dependent peroxiredoxin